MNEKVFMDQYQKNFLDEEEFIVFLQERKKTLLGSEKRVVKSVF